MVSQDVEIANGASTTEQAKGTIVSLIRHFFLRKGKSRLAMALCGHLLAVLVMKCVLNTNGERVFNEILYS